MKIGFIPNSDRDIKLKKTMKLMSFVKKRGHEPILYEVANTNYSASDFLVVLGGDGTMLRAAVNAVSCQKPLLGINLGTLGYLTDVEKTEAEEALEKALRGEYHLEKRMMLKLLIRSKNGDNKQFIALNDAYISRGTFAKLTEIRLTVNGEYIDTYRADGLIISTPTGSTAYNLSAGGPILKPDGNMIAVTPVCPHTLYARPFVVSSEDIVSIKHEKNDNDKSVIAMDGFNACEINGDDEIIVCRNEQDTIIMKTNRMGFYDILRLKMMGGCRNEGKTTIKDN